LYKVYISLNGLERKDTRFNVGLAGQNPSWPSNESYVSWGQREPCPGNPILVERVEAPDEFVDLVGEIADIAENLAPGDAALLP
jgi:hypothetical protein